MWVVEEEEEEVWTWKLSGESFCCGKAKYLRTVSKS